MNSIKALVERLNKNNINNSTTTSIGTNMSTKQLAARLKKAETKLNSQAIVSQEHIMIGDTRIEMVDGLYCLNDLHKASEAKASKSPSKWLANKSTQAFLSEARIRVSVQHGNGSSTFAEKKAVYAYAMWISPVFQSNVIDVFDAYVTGTLQTQVPQEQPKAQHLIPQTLSEALLLAGNLAQENEQQSAQLAIAAPKVDYHDKVISSTGTYRTGIIAAELGMTATKLNKILCSLGIQRKMQGRWLITAMYVNEGLGKESTHTSGAGGSYGSLMWTQQGRKFINEIIGEMSNQARQDLITEFNTKFKICG